MVREPSSRPQAMLCVCCGVRGGVVGAVLRSPEKIGGNKGTIDFISGLPEQFQPFFPRELKENFYRITEYGPGSPYGVSSRRHQRHLIVMADHQAMSPPNRSNPTYLLPSARRLRGNGLRCGLTALVGVSTNKSK